MAINVFPAAAGGGIKLVQRGEAVSGGTTTITAVDVTKTFVRSFSTGSAGTVATNSVNPSVTSSGTLSPSGGGSVRQGGYSHQIGFIAGTFPTYTGTRTITSGTMSGGSMNATVKEFGVHLTNSTTLTATGACRWEVVEFA